MKNIHVELIVSSFLLCIISILFEINEVQAKNNEIEPLNSFFGSWERRHLQELRDTHRREPENVEDEKAEFPTFRRRRQKKNKKKTENNKEIFPKNSAKKKNRKKMRKRKSNKRFVKTQLKNVDIDSRMSNSIDSDTKNKPVDIIVHIKMNDK